MDAGPCGRYRRFYKWFAANLVFWAALALPLGVSSQAVPGWVQISDPRVPNGGVLVLTAEPPIGAGIDVEVVGKFSGDTFKFIPLIEPGAGPKKVALVGISYFQKAGTYEVEVEARVKAVAGISTGPLRQTLKFEVFELGYRTEKLSVDPKKLRPTKKDLRRINAEKNEIGRLYRDRKELETFDAKFVLPIESAVTSPYGTKRTFNGLMQSFHQGLDLKAKDGTPVVTAAGGIVVMAKDLYFTGNTILVDHGYGIVTVYAHISKLDAPVGTTVQAGQRIGLSGSTGRVSGPHLHWGAVIRGVKVDPGLLPLKPSVQASSKP
ncbi:MAG: M23 family metallopeptidase [Bdellovibrionota bacterium]